MLFNSLQFLVFFSIATAAHFALPQRFRWILLLVASCYFYMVLVPRYVLILIFLILVDYIAGLIIERSQGVRRKQVLVASLVANIGMLGVFKYFNFVDQNLAALFNSLGFPYLVSNLHIILPIGLSFHTFQSMSYTIEVYRGRYKAEHHLGIYACYVLFYPQMVAGPIERPQNLLRQFRDEKVFDYQRVTDGLKLMVWGLFKKWVIADRLAILVNQVYASPTDYAGWPLLLATYAFAFQIYCDFSGYSDIAIGAAQVMGFKLMTNFNRPYYAKSIGEFWKRWHISLSTWFRDYLYIPLGGNRVVKWRWYFNLFIVFLVSGLWHGANWTYVIWGGLHGFYLIFSIWTERTREKVAHFFNLHHFPTLRKWLRMFITFHLVLLSWVFFRAKSVSEVWFILTHMFSVSTVAPALDLGLHGIDIPVAVIALLIMESVHMLQRHTPIRHLLANQSGWLRWSVYSTAVLMILLFGEFTSRDFIYFQF
jgi:D-alanyl-lipoteichoic acid acyltransferase DltB (MBOAT superfamily)